MRANDVACEKVEATWKIYRGMCPEKTYINMGLGQEYFTLEQFDASLYGENLHRSEYVRTKRAELAEIVAAKELAEKRSGHCEAEQVLIGTTNRCFDQEDAILRMVPKSRAGAAALLRLMPRVFEDERDEGVALAFAAIARVVEYLEGRESA